MLPLLIIPVAVIVGAFAYTVRDQCAPEHSKKFPTYASFHIAENDPRVKAAQ